MNRVFNFSAGPAMLPLPVLEQVQKELLDYKGSGMSVMEMSHRSNLFTDIITGAENTLREIMNIPDNYKVLFVQGGASQQFAAVPLNLMKNQKADFVNTGSWSKKAMKEAAKYIEVNEIASSADKNFSYIPEMDASRFDSEADFVHITTNNTIEGTVFKEFPNTGNVPLVADMSSNILSEEIDVTKFGIIYAGAQKNIGPAGLTIVIIREDLIGRAADICPTMLDYKTHSESGSLYNTPPTFGVYIAKLVFEWIKEQGGVKVVQQQNEKKAALLYDYISTSDFYHSPIDEESRSLMNVPFTIPNRDLDAKFIEEAKKNGLDTLKGHRSVGGMRASIYNAMPLEGVEKLVQFMKQFKEENK